MVDLVTDDQAIKQSLTKAKIIAMVGVSSIKKEDVSNVVRRPSIIVMNYLQEFGYRVIPVNPFCHPYIAYDPPRLEAFYSYPTPSPGSIFAACHAE